MYADQEAYTGDGGLSRDFFIHACVCVWGGGHVITAYLRLTPARHNH